MSTQDVESAGVTRAGRVDAVRDGVMVAQDGTPIEASAIIWAAGYHPDYSWIEGLRADEHGYPFHHRGISSEIPGMGFLGIPSQYGLTSGIIGGAGRDARYLARRLAPGPAEVPEMGVRYDSGGRVPERD